MGFSSSNYLKLRKMLKESSEGESVFQDILKKERAGKELSGIEEGQRRMLDNMFGYKEVQKYEDQLFYAMGKYPEVDDAFRAGRMYIDDDVLTSMFDKKITSLIDDFAARADALKGKENAIDEAMVLVDEFLDYDIPELLKDRKSLNDLFLPNFETSLNGVDLQGKLDVLTDALKQIRYSDKMSPEYLAHNLRGMKAHVNTLPQAQKTHDHKFGTADDTEFWDGHIESDYKGEFSAQERTDSDMIWETENNIVKEGKYTPVDLPADTTYTTSEGFMPVANPRQQGDFSELDAAAQRIREIEAEAATAPDMMRQVYSDPESYAKGEKVLEKTGAEMDAIMAEVERLKKKKIGGIIKKAGGGFMGRPLYDD